ncbi:unnamed protein product [Musa acuminata var. zebrina]
MQLSIRAERDCEPEFSWLASMLGMVEILLLLQKTLHRAQSGLKGNFGAPSDPSMRNSCMTHFVFFPLGALP